MGEMTVTTLEGRQGPATSSPIAGEADDRNGRNLLRRLRTPRRPKLWFEILLIAVSYWTYSLIRNAVPEQKSAALRNADWIWDVEQSLGLAFERSVNHAVDSVTWLIVGMNYYYATLHFIVTLGVPSKGVEQDVDVGQDHERVYVLRRLVRIVRNGHRAQVRATGQRRVVTDELGTLALDETDWRLLLCALALYPTATVFRVVRWRLLLRAQVMARLPGPRITIPQATPTTDGLAELAALVTAGRITPLAAFATRASRMGRSRGRATTGKPSNRSGARSACASWAASCNSVVPWPPPRFFGPSARPLGAFPAP